MSNPGESLQTAVEHHRNGQLEEAEKIYQKLLDANPRDADALHLLGVVAHQRGRNAVAMNYISQAISLLPDRPDFYANLTAVTLALGKVDDAIHALRELVRVDPQNEKARNDLGVLFAKFSRWAEAEQVFRELLEVAPQSVAAQNNLANIFLKQGKFKEAEAAFRAVIAAKPDSPEAYDNLGAALAPQGRGPEAIAAHQEAVRLAPDYAIGHYNLAIALEKEGRLAEAIPSLRQALAARPSFVEAQYLLGRAYMATGQLAEALDCIQKVIDRQPSFAEGYASLGWTLRELGRVTAAREALEEAIRIKPASALAHSTLGSCYLDLEENQKAMECFTTAIQILPRLAIAHFGLAKAHWAQKQLAEAAEACENAVEFDPDNREMRVQLGLIYMDLAQPKPWQIESRTQQLLDDAMKCQQQVIDKNPDFAPAYHARGAILERQGKYEEALADFREAVRLNPRLATSHHYLGGMLSVLGRESEAIQSFNEAIKLVVGYVHDIDADRVVTPQTSAEEAIAIFERLMTLPPADEDADPQTQLTDDRRRRALAVESKLAAIRHNRSMAMLVQGDFARAWPEYEQRLKSPPTPPADWLERMWDGSPLEGRSILLHFEQGVGDTLHFARYAPLVKERGGQVLLVCPKSLADLLGTCPGIDRICPLEEPIPQFDVFAPLMSLPGIFQTDLGSVPAPIPYLKPPGELEERFAKQLESDKFRVGINWQGNPTYYSDQFRSMPLAKFAPLASISEVQLVSLQKGIGRGQLATCDFEVTDLGSQIDEQGKAFYDTAALIERFDLVITSDTALAHLVGAMGRPVWVALPYAADWRWLRDREDTPWYPTMRLFRQKRLGDWDDVFERIAKELAYTAAESRRAR